MIRGIIEKGVFKNATIAGDWHEHRAYFSYAESGAIVVTTGWDCEIWLYPDGTYFSSINPRIYRTYRGAKGVKKEGWHQSYPDGCRRHRHCETCPFPDCIAKDGEF